MPGNDVKHKTAIISFFSIFLFVNARCALAAESGYFNRFYKPGPLQQYLLVTNDKQIIAKPEGAVTETKKTPETLSLESPELGPPPASDGPGLTAGPLSNIVFGGTLDYRFLFPKDMTSGMFMIHVNELFITTNIGDSISLLAEQLLVTSDLGTAVGQDHGFAYVIISNLSFLPKGMAVRIGRMRLKYGIDAKLDGPANPLRTPEYRTLGFLSDRAIEVGGFAGPLEYVAAVAMGPDFVLREVQGTDGLPAGDIKTDARNSNHPVILRVGTEFSGSTPNVGLSYYSGKNYAVRAQDGFQANDVMLFGGFMDQRTLALKRRESLDLRWNVWKLKLSGEYTVGSDTDSTGHRRVSAYSVRSDFAVVPQKFILQGQYDYFSDGRTSDSHTGSPGFGATYHFTEQSWFRGFGQVNERVFSGTGGAWVAGTQLLFAF